MAQKTNLNISPYYDDFDAGKNFYRVLFKPGFPVQARELTTLQSILQNQVESFGNNIFKEGSMVLPGAATFDNQFSAVKLNAVNLGVDVSVYIQSFVGKTITGQTSGVTASIQKVAFTSESDSVTDLTIYVNYKNSGDDSTSDVFLDGESLSASENVTYGNTTINAGTPFASLIADDATSIGSAVSIDNGVYFVRGTFVNVSKQTIILDYYTNTPTYRIGLRVDELLVGPKDDESLYDNAKGFTNFAAPGADRLKISLTLTKKPINDLSDANFIEILRVEDGAIKKVVDKSVYNIIRDYIAERTYDESGSYAVDEFDLNILECLNDRLGNDGIYLDTEVTEQGNDPSDDLMCVQVSPGKAYVKGYDVEVDVANTIDVEKPRDTETIESANIPYEMGHLLRVNNVDGAPKENEIVTLKSQFKGDGVPPVIGQARVYGFNLTDAAYTGASTQWDLYLYDIQTQTDLTLNTSTSLAQSSFVKGKSSGASGYVVDATSNSTSVSLNQTSGTFFNGEQLNINGVDTSIVASAVTAYGTRDIKSVAQNASGFPVFTADSVLSRRKFSNGITEGKISGGNTLKSAGKLFSGVKVGDIVRYQTGTGDERFNKVTAVSADLSSLTIATPGSVAGVFDGTVTNTPTNTTYSIELGIPELRNNENAFLYAVLPEQNISSVNLADSQLLISKQLAKTISATTITLDATDLSSVGISTGLFESFDQERYSVHYSSGNGIGAITSDAFKLTGGGSSAEISGLNASGGNSIVNVTLKKSDIRSKTKEYTRSTVKNINLSKLSQSGSTPESTLNDGLTYNQYYGLRVQDDQISLGYPDVVKVLAVYESTSNNDPVLTRVQFPALSNVDNDAVIGEDIVGSDSGAIARVVTKPQTNNLGIVYLNSEQFSLGETVTFKESNIVSNIQVITIGQYKDLTNNYNLDKGQKNEFYDYSRLVKTGSLIPEKRLLVVFDHYTVPSSDNGDVFTVLSYDAARFSKDIPEIGPNRVRASDTLDFRPRVADNPGTSASPFAFSSRNFSTAINYNLKAGESSLLGYDFYLPRIDRVYLDKFSGIIVTKGISSLNPNPPENASDDLMQIAEISLPAYLYNVDDAEITLIDNRRYTMRDIGTLEDRVENLERVTSLSLLEINTEALRIEDADGNNRFKSGFFVDDFADRTLLDGDLTSADTDSNQLTPRKLSNSATLIPLPLTEGVDLNTDYTLLDPNVQKTGNIITLKYNSVDWISQELATRVENVNPFHVIDYNGQIQLNPPSWSWTRTVYLPERTDRRTVRRTVGEFRGRNRTITSSSTTRSDVIISSENEKYIWTRNVTFTGTLLKPFTRHYQFLGNHGNVDFVPKLVEIATDSTLQNYGSSENTFAEGETVIARHNGKTIGSFRLAQSNHREGSYTTPSKTYGSNPYVRSEVVQSSYSQSSKVLNIDIESLTNRSNENFYGYIVKGAKLIGQSSGAIAYVKDRRIVTNENGFVTGSFFIKDPNRTPAPNPRIQTGVKTYTITSSSENKKPLPGSKLGSNGSTTFTATGIKVTRQIQNLITTTITRVVRRDPLAQSFTVGGNIEAPNSYNPANDKKGVLLTKVDLFFGNKASGDDAIDVEIRTMELGIPTLTRIGDAVTLNPSEIEVSDTGEVATEVIFPTPIFLPPGQEYALVLIAPTTDEYEVWTAKMGEKTVNTQNLPDAEAVRYSKQFAIGSLFKSQNGSIWTPAQESDLKFKLYKAEFTPNTPGIAHFGNTPILPDQTNTTLVSLPKTTTLGITTTTNSSLISTLSVGRKIAGTNPGTFGHIVGTGSSVDTISVTETGANYVSDTSVDTYNIVGQGSGLKLNITAAGGAISGTPVIVEEGNGYQVGDVVGIVTSSVSSGTGRDATITIASITGVDTLYLGSVQGQFDSAVGSGLSYYSGATTIVSLGSTQVLSNNEGTDLNSGSFLEVNHFNHGMYAKNNKLTISDVETDTTPTTLTGNFSTTDNQITVVNTSVFENFEGVASGAANTCFVQIGSEIIGVTTASSTQLNVVARGVDNTIVQPHDSGDTISKYEFGGVSLRRINNITHDINGLSDTNIDIDSDRYYIEIDRSANGTNRSVDAANLPQLSFSSESVNSGSQIRTSENRVYNEIKPNIPVEIIGEETTASAVIRSTTGTSIDGSEVSFQLLNSVEPVVLNANNRVSTTRLVCSRVNELNQSQFENVSGRRSLTASVTMNTTDKNISPIIYLLETGTVTADLISNDINAPITNFASSDLVKSINEDPHNAVYVSNTVNLAQEASSLKVIFSAFRPESSDIRVLYSLIRDDSVGIDQEFELFPGFDNLESASDGSTKVVTPGLNSGRPDVRVPASEDGQFLEYEFTANDLGNFSGYRIKIIMSGTNQSASPIIRDLRTLALQ